MPPERHRTLRFCKDEGRSHKHRTCQGPRATRFLLKRTSKTIRQALETQLTFFGQTRRHSCVHVVRWPPTSCQYISARQTTLHRKGVNLEEQVAEEEQDNQQIRNTKWHEQLLRDGTKQLRRFSLATEVQGSPCPKTFGVNSRNVPTVPQSPPHSHHKIALFCTFYVIMIRPHPSHPQEKCLTNICIPCDTLPVLGTPPQEQPS